MALLHRLRQMCAAALSVDTRSVRHVLEYRLRKGIGPLENHPDSLAKSGRVDPRRVDILAIEQRLARDPRPGNLIVHAVQRPQKRRLAAA